MRALLALVIGFALSAHAGEKGKLFGEMRHTGMADASGGVAVSSNLFVVADDEQNVVRVYNNEKPEPVKAFDFNSFLQVEGDAPECDLEACARIGDRIFWIGSHGRNKNGKVRPNRSRFFATDLSVTNGEIMLTPAGRPYKRLLEDFTADARLAAFDLAKAATLAPKEAGALNIEGLSATAEGHLLIGFRNPIPKDKALIVPLLNPSDVIEGKRARLGPPIRLNLDGLGIRDMAFYQGEYVVIAGASHEGGPFELYRWAGGEAKPKRITVKHLKDYSPEGIVIYPEKGLAEFQVLSDDGSLPVDGVPGKEVSDPAKKSFRSFWVRQ